MSGAEWRAPKMTKRRKTSTSWRASGAERFEPSGAQISAPLPRHLKNGLQPLRNLNFLARRFPHHFRATPLVPAHQCPPLKGGTVPHHLIGLESLLDKGFTLIGRFLRLYPSPSNRYETSTSWRASGAGIVSS